MIAALVAAGLLSFVQWDHLYRSNVPISDLADELERTGEISCGLSPKEKRLSAGTMRRVLKRRNPDEFTDQPLVFGCTVLRVAVRPDGSVKNVEVVRYKGGNSLRDLVARHYRFKPSAHEWTGLVYAQTRSSPESVSEDVARLRELDANIAAGVFKSPRTAN